MGKKSVAQSHSGKRGNQRRISRRRRIALVIETSNAYARNLLQGVVAYARDHAKWSFYLLEQGRGDDPPAWLSSWKGDGILARIESNRIAEAVVNSGLPAVDLSAGRCAPSLPWVETDDSAIARLALDHFLERGFHDFAFCGDPRFQWSRRRGESFRVAVQQAGHRCFEMQLSGGPSDLTQQLGVLEDWIKSLPKPVGIFACYDIRGQQILDACRNAGLAVPEEVAVIGVDNDELLCELAFPPMSSVVPNARHTGYQAAALLDRIMRGEAVPIEETRIPPIGIQLRQSSDILAVEDSHLAQALRFIREHACDPIDVADVVRVVPLSRRVLEARFMRFLRRSPHAEILAVRVARVKQLLANTDLSLEEIAIRTGFEHPEYLSVVFKREAGVSPRDFRQTLRR